MRAVRATRTTVRMKTIAPLFFFVVAACGGANLLTFHLDATVHIDDASACDSVGLPSNFVKLGEEYDGCIDAESAVVMVLTATCGDRVVSLANNVATS